MGDEAAGADRVAEAHPLLVVGVVAPPQEVLGALEVGLLIDHPAATVHADGVAAAEVRLQVGVVAAALIVAALEAPVLVEGDLQGREGAWRQEAVNSGPNSWSLSGKPWGTMEDSGAGHLHMLVTAGPWRQILEDEETLKTERLQRKADEEEWSHTS